jgi:4-amino-4-deoxy-L-arabinose transferase-like glycosyltransferase
MFISLLVRKRIAGFELVVASVAVAFIASRFVGLDYSPPRLAMDESLGAAHLGCLGTVGTSADGKPWPLFAYGFGGGFYTPVYLYFGLLWTKIFGLSIAAVRGIPAFFVTATIFGIYAVAKRIGGARLGLWALLAASVSPWGFHYSRVAWDPPLAPAFLIWCIYFWLSRRAWWGGALSGAMFAGAIYSYPPMRAQAPLMFACVFLLTWRTQPDKLKRTAAFIISSIIFSLPLLRLMISPDFMGRSSSVSIFTADYINAHRGEYGPIEYFVTTFLDNLATHLRPSFLFFTGDSILRHSPHHFGEFGWLDDFALLGGLILAGRALFSPREAAQSRGVSPRERRLLALALSGILLGLTPAALTWESIPHATRAIGAWPFVSLLTGTLLHVCERHWPRAVRFGSIGMALVFSLFFGRYYFTDYIDRATGAFAPSYYRDALRRRAELGRPASDLTLYLLMSTNQPNCGK